MLNTQRSVSIRVLLLAIIFIGAVLRFSFYTELQNNPMPEFTAHTADFDQYNFLTMAVDLLENNWIGSSFRDYSATYSYFIAFCFKVLGQSLNSVFIAQIILGLFGIYLYYKTVNLLFDNQQIGLVAAGIAALYAPIIFYECVVLRASLMAFFNLLSFYLLLRGLKEDRKRYIFAGALSIGFATLLRPGVLIPFLFIYLVLLKCPWKKKILILLTFVAGVLIVMTPLRIRNNMLGSDAVISKPGTTIFWLGNSYDSAGIGLTRTDTQKTLAAETEGRVVKTVQVLLREIKNHPQEYAGLYWRKFKMLFNAYEIPGNLNFHMFQENMFSLKFAVINFAFVCPLALLGLILSFRKFKYASLFYVYFFVLCGFVFAFHIQARYRMPVIPFFIILSSYGLVSLIQVLKSYDVKKIFITTLALLMLTWFTYYDQTLIKTYFGSRINYFSYSNWGFAYANKFVMHGKNMTEKQQKDTLLKALDYQKKSIAIMPEEVKPMFLLEVCKLNETLRDYDEALRNYSKILTYLPDNPFVLERIAAIHQIQQRR